MPTVSVKRVYDDPSPRDGMRVLVDRLWPRGLTKEKAAVALWLKDIAPSPALRPALFIRSLDSVVRIKIGVDLKFGWSRSRLVSPMPSRRGMSTRPGSWC